MYKISHLNQFNLGNFIFDNLVTYSGIISSKGLLSYPSLIYKLIVAKGFQRENAELISCYAFSLRISHMLCSGPIVIDLPYRGPGDSFAPAAPSTDVPRNVGTRAANIQQLQPAFITAQISTINNSISNLNCVFQKLELQRQIWENLLSAVTGGVRPDVDGVVAGGNSGGPPAGGDSGVGPSGFNFADDDPPAAQNVQNVGDDEPNNSDNTAADLVVLTGMLMTLMLLTGKMRTLEICMMILMTVENEFYM